MAAQEAARDEPPQSQLLIIVLSVVLMFVTALAMSFRLYTRLSVSRKLFVEDLLMIGATVFAFGLSSVYTLGAFHGYGQQISQIISKPGNLELVYNVSFAVTYLYTAASYLVKMSFLALYHRLDSRKPMRLAVYVLFAVESGQAVAAITFTSLSWAPLSDLTRGKRPVVGPTTIQDFYNANGIVTAITSAVIYSVPLWMLHNLELPKRQKWAVGALFSLGFLSTAAACLKTYYSWSLVSSPDLFSKITTSCLWIQVEVHAAIVCGSAQTFRVLLKGFCPGCCRNTDEETATHSATVPDFPHPPNYSPELVETVSSEASLPPPPSASSVPSDVNQPRTYHNSWKDWDVSVDDVSRTPTPNEARGRSPTPRMVELRSPSRNSAMMPPGVQQNYPSIASRIDTGEEGVHSIWVYESTPGKRSSRNWPLP